ncbi:hypothetical protein Tco_1010777 [Tanacetum coccineum]
MDANKQICLRPSPSNLQCASTVGAIMDKKNSNIRRHSIGQAFHNNWRRIDTENKSVAANANANANASAPTNTTANAKTSTSMVIAFLLKDLHVSNGTSTELALRSSWGQNNESGWGTKRTETEPVWGSKKPKRVWGPVLGVKRWSMRLKVDGVPRFN